MGKLNCFNFWCQKILPLIYDDSLTPYEMICKLADGFNELKKLIIPMSEDVEDLKITVKAIQDELEALKSGDYAELLEIIQNAIKNVYFGLTDTGYFIAYIPDSWADVVFNTTGYDYSLLPEYNYGHLVLSMNVENPEWATNHENISVPVTPK